MTSTHERRGDALEAEWRDAARAVKDAYTADVEALFREHDRLAAQRDADLRALAAHYRAAFAALDAEATR